MHGLARTQHFVCRTTSKMSTAEAAASAGSLSPRALEADQLRKRYPSTSVRAGTYDVDFHPTDPDLPVSVQQVHITLSVPALYPACTPKTVTAEVSSSSLPPKIISAINLLLRRHIDAWPSNGQPIIRQLLRWLENTGFGQMLRTVIELQSESVSAPAYTPGPAAFPTHADASPTSSSANRSTSVDASRSQGAPDELHASGGDAAPALPPSTAAAPLDQRQPDASSSSSAAAPDTQLEALQRVFGGQATWTYKEQEEFEDAVREMFVERGKSIKDPAVWRAIASRVSQHSPLAAAVGRGEHATDAPFSTGTFAASAALPTVRSPEECVARYLVLRRICRDWMDACVRRPEPSADVTAQRAAAAAAAATARSRPAAIAAQPQKQQPQYKPKPATSSKKAFATQRVSLSELDYDHEPPPRQEELETAAELAVEDVDVDGYGEGHHHHHHHDSHHHHDHHHHHHAVPAERPTAEDAGEEEEVDMFGRVISKAAPGGGDESGDGDTSDDDAGSEESGDEADDKYDHLYGTGGGDSGDEGEEEDVDSDGEARSGDGRGRRPGRADGDTGAAGARPGADEEDEEEEAEAQPPPLRNVYLQTPHKGFQMVLEKLSIFGIGTLAASNLVVLAQCERCNTVLSATMKGAQIRKPGEDEDGNDESKPGGSIPSQAAAAAASAAASASIANSSSNSNSTHGEYKTWCPKCSLLLTLNFRPTLVHEGNPSLGYVDTIHCSVLSLVHASLIATCLECGSHAELAKLQPPQTWEVGCKSGFCYSRLRMDVRGAAVELASLDNVRVAAAQPVNKKRAQTFVAGKPLPNEGTCRHYKQSYRWMRFPCCNLAYPCDACHDENNDHHAEWAKRMICGHCAREQPFSNAPCVSCGGNMTRSTRFSRFWEGGQGQRNRKLLSRKDPHKVGAAWPGVEALSAVTVGTTALQPP